MQEEEIRFNLPVFAGCPGAVAIDLDGTLLDSRTRLSARNRRAIEKCIDRGIPVIIATSRPVRSVRRYLGDELTGICSLVLQNGAIALATLPLSGKFKEAFAPGIAGEIVDVTLGIDPGMRITAELEGYAFGTNLAREPEELWEFNSATPDMQLSLETALAGEPTKIAVSGAVVSIRAVAGALRRRFGDSISVVPADDTTFLNITSGKATKPRSVSRLLASRGITLENVVAFGDDTPDLDLLQACGMPVATANAIPEVKAAADYCTASNDDDGVAVVLERITEYVAKIK
jgi:Cof subfamily protein (haloacid dehalogenase superfamily)